MALVEGCKHRLEFTVPASEVAAETERAAQKVAAQVRLPGFRPGKAPLTVVKQKFAQDIRQEVVEALIPKYLRQRFQEENLNVVSQPNITDLHFHGNEDLHFKAEFEVAPDIDLGEYRGIEAKYEEPAAADDEIDKRIEALRDQKAEFVNEEPRPIVDGDFAVVSLETIEGVEGEPIKNDEMVLHVGDADTMPEFTENLRGMQPGESKEFPVTYPEDYGQPRLAGKTVKFQLELKMVRRKELPALDDEFAQSLGDFKTVDELKAEVKKAILREKEYSAQEKAKSEIIEKLVDAHTFPVPEVYVERQIEINVENYLRSLAMQGIDPRQVKLDWEKIRESQKDRAVRDVKATLLLDRIAEREAIAAMNDDVDKEVQRIARQEREPVAATRMKLEKDGALGRIATRIRTEKTLNFLFENAKKIA
jgi:trigger factor